MSPARRILHSYVGIAILLSAVALLTRGSLSNPFVFDDIHRIVDNQDIRHLDELPERLVYEYGPVKVLERNDPSRPLVALCHTVIYHWAKLDPAAYRACNVIMHLINVLLVYLLGLSLFRCMDWGDERTRRWAALTAAAMFAAAPINLGTTIYIYAISDILAATGTLVALLLLGTNEAPSLVRTGLAVLSTLFALLAKQSAAVIPLLISFTQLTVGCKKDSLQQTKIERVARGWPVWLVVIFYLGWRFWYFGELGDVEGDSIRRATMDYITVEPWAILRYLQLTFVPYGLTLDHGVTEVMLSLATRASAALLLFVVVVWSSLTCRRSDSPMRRLLAWAVLFALLALAPTSSFMPTVDYLVERRAYLPSAAWFIAVGALAWLWAGRFKQLIAPGIALWLILGFYISHQRIEIFRSEEALWEDVLALYPKNPRALTTLGTLRFTKHDHASAKRLFEAALAAQPDSFITLNNLGTIHMIEGSPFYDLATAKKYFVEAVRIKPDFAFAFVMLGRLCLKMENPGEAESYFRLAIKLRPDNFAAQNELGGLLLQLGRYTEAETPLRAALKLALGADIMPAAHDRTEERRMASLNLALSLQMQNRTMEAATLYRDLLRLNPNDAIAISRLVALYKTTQ